MLTLVSGEGAAEEGRTMTSAQQIETAARHLDAVETAEGWAYYDRGMRAWYVVEGDDMARYGAMLERGEDDAHSRWCSSVVTDQRPNGWEPTPLGGA